MRAGLALLTRFLCRGPQSLLAAAGCHPVFVTRDLSDPLGDVLRHGSKRSHKLRVASAETTSFSVLGQGYNAITGFPLAYGMSAMDPGFT